MCNTKRWLSLLFPLAAAPAALAQQLPSEDAGPQAPFLRSSLHGGGSYLGLGTIVRGPIDVQSPTADLGCLGVEFAWDHYWVTGRKNAAAAGPHYIYKFDLSGALLASIVQGGAAGSTWGGRDIATDEGGYKFWMGQESSRLDEYEYDSVTGFVSYVTSYTIVGGPTVLRGLARNPASGHFYTSNLVSTIQEFTINPVVIVATYPANGKAHYGLAYAHGSDKLWTFAQNNDLTGSMTGDAVTFYEMTTVGVLTGVGFVGVLMGVTIGNIAGGTDLYGDSLNDSHQLSIVGLHQATPDQLFAYDLATAPGFLDYRTTYCTAKVSSNGCHPRIRSTGIPSATAASGHVVSVDQMLNNKSCTFFYGVSGRAAAPFAGGTNCVAAATRLLPASSSGGSPPPNDCSGAAAVDMNAFAQGLLGGTPPAALQVPGTVVDQQLLARDPGYAAPNNILLSNAVEFTIGP